MSQIQTIGILGGGQLGMMLGESAKKLGLMCVFLDPADKPPAAKTGEVIKAKYDDEAALKQLADRCDVITYEFENVPVSAVKYLEGLGKTVYPKMDALETAQDRVFEKSLFEKIGIPTPPFKAVKTEQDLYAAMEIIGVPAVMKTCRQGYDGKGQAIIKTSGDVLPAWNKLQGLELVIEKFISFQRELSMICVRSTTGETAFYPLNENVHRQGILRITRSPTTVTPAVQAQAESYAKKLLDHFNYIGVLTIEFCDVDGQLMAIEMAPRVHNSGHWTIEGAQTSQFENHLRAITGQPLGPTQATGSCAMLNIIGIEPTLASLIGQPGVYIHMYGKQPQPGRKLGHITLVAQKPAVLQEMIKVVQQVIG
ncbi:MAG: 5-(carboxyamino)imidazole ribonucleotide synthase [Candidatus Peribacteraceae bacterium]|nr:5-(carboxyamino)imidazole ribonucleotide synthase [Candidatus Peribacteraceae bacterium]